MLEGGVSSSAQKGNGLKMAAGSSAGEHGKMILKGRWYRLEDSAWEATCYRHLRWVWPVETANSSTICTSAGWVFFIQIKVTLVHRCYILLLEFSWVPFGSPSTNIVHLCWKSECCKTFSATWSLLYSKRWKEAASHKHVQKADRDNCPEFSFFSTSNCHRLKHDIQPVNGVTL